MSLYTKKVKKYPFYWILCLQSEKELAAPFFIERLRFRQIYEANTDAATLN
jgi:hypothetical protein